MRKDAFQNLLKYTSRFQILDDPKYSLELDLEKEISQLEAVLEQKKSTLRSIQERCAALSLERIGVEQHPGEYVLDLTRSQSYIIEKVNPIEVRSVY